MNKTTRYGHEQILGKDYPTTNQISAEQILELHEFPPTKLPKLSGYAIKCWGYKGSIISHPKLANPTSAVSILQHITKKPSEIVYLNLRKASVTRVMAILPNSRPSTGWRQGYLTNELHKRDFRCRRTKLRYSRTATIKLWRQHLGAQLPGTLPQPLNVRRHQEQCSRHKTIRRIPRYPRDPKKISEIWEEKSQNSTSGCLTRAMKGLRSKKNS